MCWHCSVADSVADSVTESLRLSSLWLSSRTAYESHSGNHTAIVSTLQSRSEVGRALTEHAVLEHFGKSGFCIFKSARLASDENFMKFHQMNFWETSPEKILSDNLSAAFEFIEFIKLESIGPIKRPEHSHVPIVSTFDGNEIRIGAINWLWSAGCGKNFNRNCRWFCDRKLNGLNEQDELANGLVNQSTAANWKVN